MNDNLSGKIDYVVRRFQEVSDHHVRNGYNFMEVNQPLSSKHFNFKEYIVFGTHESSNSRAV